MFFPVKNKRLFLTVIFFYPGVKTKLEGVITVFLIVVIQLNTSYPPFSCHINCLARKLLVAVKLNVLSPAIVAIVQFWKDIINIFQVTEPAFIYSIGPDFVMQA